MQSEPITTNILSSEKLYDTKELIRSPKSKDRQHNGQIKNDKRTNNDLQIHVLENDHIKFISLKVKTT